MSGQRAGIRWRDDVGWELRCDDCMVNSHSGCYWPLTDEFWDRRVMTRCRACHMARRRRSDRARYSANPEWRAKRVQAARDYRSQSGDVTRLKRRDKRSIDAAQSKARYWANPEQERAKSRDYYWRNRDRILNKRREGYVSRKAA